MEEIAIAPGTEISPATPETPTPETPETPTPETPADGSAPPDTGEGSGEGDDTELPGEPEPDENAIDTDGRALDAKTRQLVAELKKTNPVAAKALADQFFRRLAYEKEFPTVQDARQAKATMEALGGQEGITAIQEEVSDYRKEIEQFSNGDPELIQSLYKGNPESTVKMVEAALDVFRENNNVNALDQVLLGPIVQRLKEVGLHSNLLKIAEFVKAGDGQKAYDTLTAVGEWLAKITGDAENLSKNRVTKDPEKERFAQEKQQFEKDKNDENIRRLSDDITLLNNRHLSKTVDPFFKELKLSHEGRREFTQNLLAKVWAAMKEDKIYLRDAQNTRKKGDNKRTAEFISAKFAEKLPSVFRSYKNALYPNLARAAAKPGPQLTPTNGKPAPRGAMPAGNGAPIKVADAPAYEDVDWTKTPDSLWLKGFAYLKNGKYVNYY